MPRMDKNITRMRSDAFSTDPTEGTSCVTDLAELWRTECPSRNVFLDRMHRKSLRLTTLKSSPPLQQRYNKLREALPDYAYEKFSITAGSTAEEILPAIIGLVKKHSGEIVEVNKQKAKWTLFQLKPGSASSSMGTC